MASEFKSAPVSIEAPVERVYSRFSNLENLRSLIENLPADSLPADKREQLEKLLITADIITVQGGPTGAVTMRVVERVEPSLIALQPENIPMKLSLQLRLSSDGPECTSAVAAIEADIPMMLRPMVKGPLQQIVDQFASMLGAIPFGND